MCPGPAASGQHTGGTMLAERGLTLPGLEEQTGDWGDLAKTYDFRRIQCTFTHTQGPSNAFRFACVHGLSEEREAYPDLGCAIYLTICSDTPGRCQLWK